MQYEGCFIKPMIDAFEEDKMGQLPDKWKVLAFMPRRGADLPSGQCTEMKKSDSNSYDWVSARLLFFDNCLKSQHSFSSSNISRIILFKECAVLLKRNENDTAASMGKKFAASWTEFVKASPKFNRDIPYVFCGATADTGPLNKFLMDKDTVVILKRLFDGCTKDEILDDTKWMAAFFGSKEAAGAVLNGMHAEQWDKIEKF